MNNVSQVLILHFTNFKYTSIKVNNMQKYYQLYQNIKYDFPPDFPLCDKNSIQNHVGNTSKNGLRIIML